MLVYRFPVSLSSSCAAVPLVSEDSFSAVPVPVDSATEMGFMKDGCPMDEDALGGDSGAKISVVYMDSEDVSFPLEIKKLQ